MKKFVAYYRVSTAKQGKSGLGLEAQQKAVQDYLSGGHWNLTAEFTETESGKRNDRPELQAAIRHCRLTGAVLVVAKLDRLSRNLAFLAQLQEGSVPFVCADMPEANELTIHVMAAMAQYERKAISKRTKEALAAAKARGVKLGNPNGAAALKRAGRGNANAVKTIKAKADAFAEDIGPIIGTLRREGMSATKVATRLNNEGIRTPRGGRWYDASVRRLIKRLEMRA